MIFVRKNNVLAFTEEKFYLRKPKNFKIIKNEFYKNNLDKKIDILKNF